MAAFEPLVEVDFEGAGEWTDITPWTRVQDGIAITRGRGDEQSETRAGTLALVLDNRDGRFTPGNEASPYWPNVRKGRPIRLSVVVDGTPYRRFRGFVNEWPVTFDGGGQLVLSRVTATDVFKRIGNVARMRSLLELETLALAPDAYYTLSEQAGADAAGDTSGNGQWPLFVTAWNDGAEDTLTFGEGTGPSTDGLSAVVFEPSAADVGRSLWRPLTAASGPVVLACWINTTMRDRPIMALGSSVLTYTVGLTFKADETTGRLRLSASNNRSATVSNLFGSTNIADGQTHLLAALVEPGGNVYVSIDGSPAALAASFTPHADYGPWVNMLAYDRLWVGAGPSFLASPRFTLYQGTMAHFYYARRDTMPDWSEVFAAGVPETVPERFARICRVIGVTGVVRGSSTTEIAGQSSQGLAPAQALRDVAAVDGGQVYADRETGDVVLECRSYRQDRAAALTLAELREDDLTWSDDDQYTRNLVTHTRDGGASQTWRDQASIDDFGTYADEVTLPWASDEDALLSAQWKVSNGADPPPRVVRASVVANALDQHAFVLGLDISDMVTLAGLPGGSPQAQVDVCVEGYSEAITYNHHAITFNTSPARLHRVWLLGVPGFSELGVTTKLGY